MKAQLDITAARAQRKIGWHKATIRDIEKESQKLKQEIQEAIDLNDWASVAMAAAQISQNDGQVRVRWEQIDALREVVDAGTTHIEEEGDFA